MNTRPWGSRLLRKRLLGTDPAEGLELLGGASLGSPSDEHSQCSERCCGSLSCSDWVSPPACPSLTFIYSSYASALRYTVSVLGLRRLRACGGTHPPSLLRASTPNRCRKANF